MKTNTSLIKSALMTVLLLAIRGISFGQEEKEPAPLEISGCVDVYYRANLNASNDADVASPAPASSFANLSGFSLGMTNLVVSKSGGKSGFVADLVFGPRGSDAAFNSPMIANSAGGSSGAILNQLYAYWNVSGNTTLTIGSFNAFLGYEVIASTGNYNYSTSYMFSYGPFSHTGIKADFTFGDLSVMTALMNATDFTEFNPYGQYVGGVQFGYGGAYLNFLFDDDYFQVDLTADWDVSETVYFGVNATSASDNFYGGALYLQNSFSDEFSMGLRGEYFVDTGLGILQEDESVIDLTLSANYSVGDLTIIPELRLDVVSSDLDQFVTYIDENGISEVSKSLSSFVLAAVYSF